jgi:hypothetical protein
LHCICGVHGKMKKVSDASEKWRSGRVL